jgi:hypothetical protein
MPPNLCKLSVKIIIAIVSYSKHRVQNLRGIRKNQFLNRFTDLSLEINHIGSLLFKSEIPSFLTELPGSINLGSDQRKKNLTCT